MNAEHALAPLRRGTDSIAFVASLLIVQASFDLLEMFAEVLATAGHTSRLAETAAEAVQAIEADRPEVVLLAFTIKGGVEPVLEALRGDPPVSVLLVSGARDLPERAAALGFPYLQKQFMPEALVEAVARVVASR